MRKAASFALSVLFAGTLGLAVGAEKASAAVPHPRIHEVHQRMRDINKRIREGVRSGKMTKDQAVALRQQLKQIQAQMKTDFQTNGKKELTADQDQQLNQQLNDISKNVYDDKHPGATDGSAAPAPPAGQ